MTTLPVTNEVLMRELKGMHAETVAMVDEVRTSLRLLEQRVADLEEAAR